LDIGRGWLEPLCETKRFCLHGRRLARASLRDPRLWPGLLGRVKSSVQPARPGSSGGLKSKPSGIVGGSPWQNPAEPLHSREGVPAQCIGALSCASWKYGESGLYFLLDIPRGRSGGRRGGLLFFLDGQWLLEVSGSPSCPILQVPVEGLRLKAKACTDGEDRFGAIAPRPVRTSMTRRGLLPRPGGRI
jgi:hypothetical protein